MPRIAFYTFGLLHEEHEHPHNEAFYEMAQAVFDRAAGAEGFIWVNGDEGDASPRFRDPARMTVAQTLSLWSDLASVYQFAYHAVHAEALRRRKEWFVKAQWPVYAAWWVADAHTPTWREAVDRLHYLHDHGSTPYAFDFKLPFDAEGQPLRLR